MKIVKKRFIRTLDLMIYVFILNQLQDLFKFAWIDDQDSAKSFSLLSRAMNSYTALLSYEHERSMYIHVYNRSLILFISIIFLMKISQDTEIFIRSKSMRNPVIFNQITKVTYLCLSYLPLKWIQALSDLWQAWLNCYHVVELLSGKFSV